MRAFFVFWCPRSVHGYGPSVHGIAIPGRESIDKTILFRYLIRRGRMPNHLGVHSYAPSTLFSVGNVEAVEAVRPQSRTRPTRTVDLVQALLDGATASDDCRASCGEICGWSIAPSQAVPIHEAHPAEHAPPLRDRPRAAGRQGCAGQPKAGATIARLWDGVFRPKAAPVPAPSGWLCRLRSVQS